MPLKLLNRPKDKGERGIYLCPVSKKTRRLSETLILGALFLFIGDLPNPQMNVANAAAAIMDIEEYHIKAAFIYNFLNFVEWPEGAFPRIDSPILIGIVGEDPFGITLDETLGKKKIMNRNLLIRRVKWPFDLRRFHAIFFSASAQKYLPQMIRSLEGAAVLTISDTEDFIQWGGMISFFKDEKRVGFEINQANAQKASLIISSKLMRLSRVLSTNEVSKGS